RMAQQLRSQLRQNEQGSRHQCKHPSPGLNLSDASIDKAQPPLGIPKAFLTAKAPCIFVRHSQRCEGAGSVSVWLMGITNPLRFASYREVINQINTAPTTAPNSIAFVLKTVSDVGRVRE